MNSLLSFPVQDWRRLAYANKGPFRIAAPLLIPLSWAYGWSGRIRRPLYRWGVFKKHSFPVPVLSVGNLTVGGVGKTPFTLYLAQRLRRMGHKPAILLRGYGRKSNQPVLIQKGTFEKHRIQEYGDEPSLLAFLADFSVAISPNRVKGVRQILDETDCDMILLDDGFQHLRLKRDLDLVVFDASNPFGNGYCLPYGPLREPRSALRGANGFILNGEPSASVAETLNTYSPYSFSGGLKWLGFYPLSHWMKQEGGAPLPIETYQREPVILVSGVGAPGRLQRQAKSYDLTVESHVRFPDHHWFSEQDMRILTLKSRSHPVLMTEKDAIRLFTLKEIPDELMRKTFVIHAAWLMKQTDRFDRWLEKEILTISYSDTVESNPVSG